MKNPKIEPWLKEGINRLASKGLYGLNVSDIAGEIDIAKSSFYHYFSSKDDYLIQLLDYWEEVGTVRIVKKFLLQPEKEKPLFHLIEGVFEKNFLNECVLMQLRNAVNVNLIVKNKVEEVEKIRISFMASLVNKKNANVEESFKIAEQVYIFFLGNLALCNHQLPTNAKRKSIMEDFTSCFGDI